jgi:hypothetical protein
MKTQSARNIAKVFIVEDSFSIRDRLIELTSVTTGDETTSPAFKAAAEIDECLWIKCPEDELFAVVQRLISYCARRL